MNTTLIRALASLLIVLLSTFASADEPSGNPKAFKPYGLVGDWQFINANTGVKYGGDIKVQVNSNEGAGVMRGVISYDGRQTNDNCSTKGVLSDEPVEAEITKTNSDYKISFRLNCSKGESPRLFSWTLVCDDGTCTRAVVLPHGKGMTTLKEKY